MRHPNPKATRRSSLFASRQESVGGCSKDDGPRRAVRDEGRQLNPANNAPRITVSTAARTLVLYREGQEEHRLTLPRVFGHVQDIELP